MDVELSLSLALCQEDLQVSSPLLPLNMTNWIGSIYYLRKVCHAGPVRSWKVSNNNWYLKEGSFSREKGNWKASFHYTRITFPGNGIPPARGRYTGLVPFPARRFRLSSENPEDALSLPLPSKRAGAVNAASLQLQADSLGFHWDPYLTMPPLTDAHKVLIQALISRGPLTEEEFHSVFSGVTGKNPGQSPFPPPLSKYRVRRVSWGSWGLRFGMYFFSSANQQKVFSDYLLKINRELSYVNCELRGCRNQNDGKVYYGFVNNVADEESKLGTKYSVPQIAYYRAIVSVKPSFLLLNRLHSFFLPSA